MSTLHLKKKLDNEIKDKLKGNYHYQLLKAFHMPKLSHNIIYIYTYSTSMNIQEHYMQETTHCRSKTCNKTNRTLTVLVCIVAALHLPMRGTN